MSRKKEGRKKQRKEKNKSNFKAFNINGEDEGSLPRFFEFLFLKLQVKRGDNNTHNIRPRKIRPISSTLRLEYFLIRSLLTVTL